MLNNDRSSNIELLRIVSMIFIIFAHYASFTEWNFKLGFEMNKFLVQYMSIGGKFGVNIFVIITGYFTIFSNYSRLKISKVHAKFLFYTWIGSSLCFIYGISEIAWDNIIRSIFPTIFGVNWFVTNFILLSLFIPFINNFLNNLSHKQYIGLLSIFFIVFSVLRTFQISMMTNNVIWFFFLYAIGAYLRKYQIDFISTPKIIGGYLFTLGAILLSIVTLDLMNVDFSRSLVFSKDYSFLNLISSVLFFEIFRRMNLKNYRIINLISATTFGIFVLHTHFLYRRVFLWNDLFNAAKLSNSLWLVPYSIFAVLTVFIIGMIIDLFVTKLFNTFKVEEKFAKIYMVIFILFEKSLYRLKKVIENN